MEAIGIVNEQKDNLVRVAITARVLCPGCATLSASGAKKQEFQAIWARNQAKAKPGDRVAVSIAESNVSILAMVFYVLPLTAFVVGCGLGKWLGSQKNLFNQVQGTLGKAAANVLLAEDNACLILGGVFLLLSFIVIHTWSRRVGKDNKFQPVAVKIIGADNAQTG